MSDRIYVGRCQFGRGVFARRALARGEEVMRFTGRRIDLAEALAKGDRQCDPLQIGPRHYLDLQPPAVLVNHSCEPNCGLRPDGVLIAIAAIAPDEEIRYDYSTTMDEDCWSLECACGAATCRGQVGDFRHLPAALRVRYLDAGIVQSFIAQKWRAGVACAASA